MAKYQQNDEVDWDRGREGYLDVPQKPVYAPVSKPSKASTKGKSNEPLLSIPAQERFGSLIAAAGMIWGAYAATIDYAGVFSFELVRPGPLELIALGILVWLHAKWRRSMKAS